MSGRYDVELDMSSDNSLSMLIAMIEDNSKILEVGPANGRMTRYLKERKGCVVDIIELDDVSGKDAEKYSRYACLGTVEGDIEGVAWENKLSKEQYDYIVFADVLEHLRDPQKVLTRVKKYLKETGNILMSIPNVAHNAVLLNLINNEFEYQEVGLLDKTHIHFFTYKSLKKMIKESGYVCEEEKAVYCRVEDTEFKVDYDDIPADFRGFLKTRKYGNIYQFIFKISPSLCIEEREFDIDRTDLSYQFKCYYTTDKTEYYTEQYCVKQYCSLEQQTFHVVIKSEEKITGLRIDPMECSCILKHFHVYDLLDGRNELHVKITNGIISQSRMVFGCSDPLIEVDVPENSGIVRLEVRYQVEYSDNQHIIDTFHMLSGERKSMKKIKDEILADCNALKQREEASASKTFDIEVFFDIGRGINVEDSYIIRKSVNEASEIEVVIPKGEEPIRQIRLDPGSKACMVKLLDLSGTCCWTNGLCLEKNVYLFNTDDPQILINPFSNNENSIYVKLQIVEITLEFAEILKASLERHQELLEQLRNGIEYEKSKTVEMFDAFQEGKLFLEKNQREIVELLEKMHSEQEFTQEIRKLKDRIVSLQEENSLLKNEVILLQDKYQHQKSRMERTGWSRQN